MFWNLGLEVFHRTGLSRFRGSRTEYTLKIKMCSRDKRSRPEGLIGHKSLEIFVIPKCFEAAGFPNGFLDTWIRLHSLS